MKFLAVALLLLLPLCTWAQNFEDFVDFDLEFSSLSNPVVVETVSSSGRLVIFDALFSDSVTKKTSSGIEVWVTLIDGEWIGTEKIETYACKVLFRGESWLSAFPGKKPEEPADNYVPQGSRLLLVARILKYDYENEIALAEMVNYRIL